MSTIYSVWEASEGAFPLDALDRDQCGINIRGGTWHVHRPLAQKSASDINNCGTWYIFILTAGNWLADMMSSVL